MRDGTATKKKLDRAALSLFVTQGISATTIKDIAGRAKIAEGTLYRHYASKESLAESLYINAYRSIIEELKVVLNTKSFDTQIRQMVLLFAQKFDEDPILFRYLLVTQHHQVRFLSNDQSNAHNILVEIVLHAMESEQVPRGNPHVCAAIIMGVVLQAAVSRVYKRIQYKMVDDVNVLSEAILRAIQVKTSLV